MLIFDKNDIKQALSIEQIFDLLQNWGAEPEYTNFGILSSTICHNKPGEGSKKLYYYANSELFQCYSNCNSFDIFQLVIKVMEIQNNIVFNLNDAVRWIAQKLGISGRLEEDINDEGLKDWKYLANYERIQEIKVNTQEIVLKQYDDVILSRFNYQVKLDPWLQEGINQEVLDYASIGYYAGGDQITIPHFDINNRFIGLRGRTLCKMEGELYGKYRPLKVNNELYNHPLGYNLYGLNWTKENIKAMKKAVLVEGEKSVLKYASYFGIENNICVASCGSSLTSYQVQLLLSLGINELIIAFDKQYEKCNTEESNKWAKKLVQIHNKYKNEILISFLWDKDEILGYKESPLDVDKEKFLYLFKKRIIL
jgi:hypothetical protein